MFERHYLRALSTWVGVLIIYNHTYFTLHFSKRPILVRIVRTPYLYCFTSLISLTTTQLHTFIAHISILFIFRFNVMWCNIILSTQIYFFKVVFYLLVWDLDGSLILSYYFLNSSKVRCTFAAGEVNLYISPVVFRNLFVMFWGQNATMIWLGSQIDSRRL